MGLLTPALLPFYQFGELSSPNHNEMCGQCSVASSLVGAGHLSGPSDAALAVDQWMRDQGWSGLRTSGTDTWQLQHAINNFAPGTTTVDHGNNFDAIIPTLAAGRYAIVLVGSDHVGHPVPNNQAATGHWVAVYGWDGVNYHIANSGSGRVEAYTQPYFRSAYRGITLDTGITPTANEESGPMTQDEARAVTYALVGLGLGEGADTPGIGAQIEAYATPMTANVEGAISTLISDMRKNPGYVWNVVKALQSDVASLKQHAGI